MKFLICPVRNQSPEIKAIIEPVLADPEVYYPARDTKQDDPIGLQICTDNRAAIRKASEVLFVWDGQSQGCLFDLGMAFMMEKPVKVISVPPLTDGKSFQNMVIEYTREGRSK